MSANLVDRREFIRQMGFVIPALHFGSMGTGAISSQDVSRAAAGQSIELRHLRLRTAVLPEMREFYRKKIGLPIIAEKPESFTMRAGGTTIEFVRSAEANSPFYHFAFNIPENKLEKAIAWMEGRAPLIPQRSTGNIIFHFAHWNAHAIYFNDPAGNVVEFIARHTMPNAARGDFGLPDILYASEIGVVVPDVPLAADALKNRLGIRDYAGTSATFAPLGDERGLIIAFPIGRNWLASNIPTAVFPAELKLLGPVTGKHRLSEGQLEIDAVA